MLQEPNGAEVDPRYTELMRRRAEAKKPELPAERPAGRTGVPRQIDDAGREFVRRTREVHPGWSFGDIADAFEHFRCRRFHIVIYNTTSGLATK